VDSRDATAEAEWWAEVAIGLGEAEGVRRTVTPTSQNVEDAVGKVYPNDGTMIEPVSRRY
jgi:hypothetical protein